MNNETFLVKVPEITSRVGENTIGEKELKVLLRSLYFQRIRSYLQKDGRHHISYQGI